MSRGTIRPHIDPAQHSLQRYKPQYLVDNFTLQSRGKNPGGRFPGISGTDLSTLSGRSKPVLLVGPAGTFFIFRPLTFCFY